MSKQNANGGAIADLTEKYWTAAYFWQLEEVVRWSSSERGRANMLDCGKFFHIMHHYRTIHTIITALHTPPHYHHHIPLPVQLSVLFKCAILICLRFCPDVDSIMRDFQNLKWNRFHVPQSICP
jgi:hypothetical protein